MSKERKAILISIAAVILAFGYLTYWHTHAQQAGSYITNSSSIPSGACPAGSIWIYTPAAGALPQPYMCDSSGAWTALPGPYTPLYGQTGNIGGGLLLVGGCATGTATVTGATVGMTVTTPTPTDGTNLASIGAGLYGTVTAANTVTVNECALVALTPPVKQFKVAVIQ